MKAIIGIISRPTLSENNYNMYAVYDEMANAIYKSDGIPIGIMPNDNIEESINLCDGLIFQGGDSFTEYELNYLKYAHKNNIPTLGICLGMQLMSCVGEDFKVYENDTDINHFQESDDLLTHKIQLNKDSYLYKILEKDEILVNSFHNYHVSINNNYKISAYSEDGYIEGIELKDKTFHIGVQWHPEISYDFDNNSKKIIDYFINICNKEG